MEQPISIKQVLIDLISIMPQVFKEFKDNDRYAQLLNFLNTKDYYNNDDIPYPTLKQIETETELKSYHIRKQLKEMYDKLFDYDYDYSFDFNDLEIIIHVEYYKRYASIKCKKLQYIPRIGENITHPFLKAKIGTDYFYVQDIRHHFETNKHIIELFLKGGIYNSYWYHRQHKAYELGEIGIMEGYDLYEHQLKERLGLRP